MYNICIYIGEVLNNRVQDNIRSDIAYNQIFSIWLIQTPVSGRPDIRQLDTSISVSGKISAYWVHNAYVV